VLFFFIKMAENGFMLPLGYGVYLIKIGVKQKNLEISFTGKDNAFTGFFSNKVMDNRKDEDIN
jgi:hypothetical protein